jgi:hypothetical protein
MPITLRTLSLSLFVRSTTVVFKVITRSHCHCHLFLYHHPDPVTPSCSRARPTLTLHVAQIRRTRRRTLRTIELSLSNTILETSNCHWDYVPALARRAGSITLPQFADRCDTTKTGSLPRSYRTMFYTMRYAGQEEHKALGGFDLKSIRAHQEAGYIIESSADKSINDFIHTDTAHLK